MFKRVLLILMLLVILVPGVLLAYLWLRKPAQVPPIDVKVAATPERIERGRYIVEKLSDCGGCHSPRDFTRFNGPEVEGRRVSGVVFPEEFGLPGQVTAPNLTPDPETGLGQWTDGEKIRAIREGIGRNGRTLFPMMPYSFYRYMSDEDVQSVVAYLNQLPPVRNPLPATRIDFPLNLLLKGAPKPSGNVQPPDRSDRLAYGQYLVRMGGCMDCHTPLERGRLVQDKLLSGGREFRLAGGLVVSANITPDDSGIGPWSERQFIDKFAEYREYVKNGPPPAKPSSFTIMPWLNLCQLPDEDLGAIFTFLKTQKPVRNHVETHPGVSKQ